MEEIEAIKRLRLKEAEEAEAAKQMRIEHSEELNKLYKNKENCLKEITVFKVDRFVALKTFFFFCRTGQSKLIGRLMARAVWTFLSELVIVKSLTITSSLKNHSRVGSWRRPQSLN